MIGEVQAVTGRMRIPKGQGILKSVSSDSGDLKKMEKGVNQDIC